MIAHSTATIRLVSFDLDDTLWDARPVLLRAEQALQDWLRQQHPALADRLSTAALLDLRRQVIAAEPELAHDLSHVRRRALQLAAEGAGLPASVGDAAFAEFLRWRSRITPFADAEATLARLARRYTLVSLTNGNADLAAIGLDRHFALSLSPAEAGSAKPDPGMFLHACRELDIAPDQAVHVGDDADTDIGGATAAGLRSIWYNPAGKPWPGGPPATAEVRSLAELPARLVELAQSQGAGSGGHGENLSHPQY